MEQIKLNRLKSGEKFVGFLLIRSASLKTDIKGSKYYDMELSDDCAQMDAKLWNATEDMDFIRNYAIVKVAARVDTWRDKLQLKIDRIRPATQEDQVDLSQFVRSAPRDAHQMLQELEDTLRTISDEGMRALAERMLSERREKILYYPASQRLHHCVRGGLLQHTTTMLQAAEALLPVYPSLNRDLLLCGVILHDLCKMEEIDAMELGIAEDYTKRGKLIGHITQGVEAIGRCGREVGTEEETILLLQHMVLSHHDDPEFGSPKRPMFIEAEMLHHLDIMDARMYDFAQAVSGVEEGGFSDKIWHLNNIRVYHHGKK